MSVSNINKMIDYCIKMPKEDEYETGHRYPYYSCELLCSTNGLNIDRLLDIYDEDNNENNEEDLNRMETEKEEKILDTNEKIEEKENNNEKNNNIIKENISDEGDSKQKNENVKNDKNENPREEIKEESEKKPQENDEKEEEKKENHEEIQENENKDVENKTDKIEEKEEKDNIKEEKSNENIDNNEKEEAKMEIEEIDYKPEKLEEKLPNLSLVHSVLDHIFSFLNDKTSIENTVLSGYFNRIVNYLIKTKTRLTLEYLLLHREKLITKLIANINNISISNIISNILNALTEENTPEANEKYMIIVNSCIEYISKIENNSEEDINSVEFICDLLINHIIYNNKIKFSKIIDANIINNFEKIIIKFYENYEQNSSKILCLINLLTKMNKSILSNLSKKITTTKNPDDTKLEMINLINAIDKIANQYISFTSKRNDFKELVYNSFLNNYVSYCNSMNNICLCIINNQIIQRQNTNEKKETLMTPFSEQKLEKYKSSNIVELEYIISVFDIYVNLWNLFLEDEKKSEFIKEKIEQLIKTNFFKLMLEDYLKYKHNNFLSNIIVDLIKIVFDNIIAPKELMLNILQIESNDSENNKDNLISLIINDLIQNTKFIYSTSENKANQLLFSSNVTILNYIFSCQNPDIIEILNKLEKEKFFYKHFISNINNIFSKKLFKTDSNDSEVDKINSLGIKLGFGNILSQSNSNIEFSVESLNNTIEFYLKLYDKYIKGEEYESLFDERKKRLEEIKKSNEYLKLNRKQEEELEEEEDEDDDINEINLPKPVFYNSKLEQKINENEIKDNVTSDSDTIQEPEKEDKNYNDVNYWHIEIKDQNMDDLLNDL
jgi:hypothetical protein